MTDIRIVHFPLSPYLLAEIGTHRPAERGPGVQAEMWLPSRGAIALLRNQLTALADAYAKEVLGTEAVLPSNLMLNRYSKGQRCVSHIDQYFDRPGSEDTGYRTVSASVILEQAESGGEMVFQDHDRILPERTENLRAHQAVFFPADWWHEVREVKTGTRQCVVCWWRQSSNEIFRSGVL